MTERLKAAFRARAGGGAVGAGFPHFLKKKINKIKNYTFSTRNLWWNKNFRLAGHADASKLIWLVRFDPISSVVSLYKTALSRRLLRIQQPGDVIYTTMESFLPRYGATISWNKLNSKTTWITFSGAWWMKSPRSANFCWLILQSSQQEKVLNGSSKVKKWLRSTMTKERF